MQKDKEFHLEKIRRDAVDMQVYRACQYLQGLANAIEHKKMQLGYPGTLSIDKECESNAEGMLETAMACLADEPPIETRRAIAECDIYEHVTSGDMELLIDQVNSDLYQQLMQN